VLAAGEGLVVLPQGTIPRGKAFFDPELRGKTGAARLAASTGAQVVPVGLWNTEAVWPRSSSLPNVVNVLSPPTVRVRVGPPVVGLGLGPGDAVADTERLMAAIVALLPAEAREARQPTSEELVRTYPKGKVGEERSIGVEAADGAAGGRAPARTTRKTGTRQTTPRTTGTKPAKAVKAVKAPATAHARAATAATAAPAKAQQQPRRVQAAGRSR
jgi:hypothetical protein